MMLHERVALVEALLGPHKDQALALGERDCVRLVCGLLVAMGYDDPLAGVGRYRTLAGAKRLLRRRGFASLPEALDAIGLARIPPAAAICGDVVALPGKTGLHALGIALGNGEFSAFCEGVYSVGQIALIYEAGIEMLAWRVEAHG
jgi:hypothetical protein